MQQFQKPIRSFGVLFLISFAVNLEAQSQSSWSPQIPKTWDEPALASLEVPLAEPEFSPRHIAASYYYGIPVRPIYKSYPIYAPEREPAGYIAWLKQQKPEIVFDAAKLITKGDWIKAGELVFDAPIIYGSIFKTANTSMPPVWCSIAILAISCATRR